MIVYRFFITKEDFMENIIHLHFRDNTVLEVTNAQQAKNLIACDSNIVDVVSNNDNYNQSLSTYLQEVTQ
tara:strand:- start:1541 stop:1750 length:210 start_codon:yes stop_codon:yes gene_type:complete